MKIAFVFYDLHRFAGIQKAISEAANLLVEEGNVVDVYVAESLEPAFKISTLVNVYGVGPKEPALDSKVKFLSGFYKVLWAFLFLFNFWRLIRNKKYDCIIDHGTSLGLIYPFKRMFGAKFFLFRHFSITGFPSAKYLNKFWRFFCKNKKFIVLDELYKKQLESLSIRNVWVVNNPLPFKIARSSSFEKYRNILAIGRASYQKGFDVLIEAFKLSSLHSNEWKLIIVGPGVDSSEDLISRSYGYFDSIFLKGPSKNLTNLYQRAGIFIIPSRWEGVPFVFLEAISHGLPVVLSDIDIFRSISSQSSLSNSLININDVNEVANYLNFLISDVSLIRKHANFSKEMQKIYSSENIKKQWAIVLS